MISPEIFRKVRQIEIRTKGLVQNLFGGEYQSAFKGRGMVFSEVREYQFGDDIRQIDWNVTARSGRPHVKIFEEEREQTLMLCVDISPSGSFGSHHQRKQELLAELGAVLSFSAINNSDKVGLLLFSDRIEMVVPPRKGRKHGLRLIRDLFTARPEGKGTDVAVALAYLNKLLKRRSIVILASDFQAPDFSRELKITNKKHDLVNIFIEDPLELELPDMGLLPLQDSESGEIVWLDTSSKRVRTEYRARRLKRKDELLKSFLNLQVDHVALSTNESYVEPLMNFFERRARRY